MNNNTERLSGHVTWFFKFVLPVIWIWGASMFPKLLWFASMSNEGIPAYSTVTKVGLSILYLLIGGLLYRSYANLKSVRMDSRNLFISNYFREIRVPLSMVDDVTESKHDKNHPITIHLAQPSGFGPKITFIPKECKFKFWLSHPLVDHILDAAARCKKQ